MSWGLTGSDCFIQCRGLELKAFGRFWLAFQTRQICANKSVAQQVANSSEDIFSSSCRRVTSKGNERPELVVWLVFENRRGKPDQGLPKKLERFVFFDVLT